MFDTGKYNGTCRKTICFGLQVVSTGMGTKELMPGKDWEDAAGRTLM
jgi:hypothetical protein